MSDVTLESVLEQALKLPVFAQAQLRQKLPWPGNGASTRNGLIGKRVPLPFTPKDRTKERAWLEAHRREYAGQWVVLEGDTLVAHGEEAKAVFAAVDQAGVIDPLYVHLEPADELPFAGW
jgi:hypothetical protein